MKKILVTGEQNRQKWTLNKKASSCRIETTIGGNFMSGKKGMIHYPESFKQRIREEYAQGAGQRLLARKYGVSKYSIASWCGLRPEVELRHAMPSPKGRPSVKKSSPEQTIKRLKMENELLRNFLSVVGGR